MIYRVKKKIVDEKVLIQFNPVLTGDFEDEVTGSGIKFGFLLKSHKMIILSYN